MSSKLEKNFANLTGRSMVTDNCAKTGAPIKGLTFVKFYFDALHASAMTNTTSFGSGCCMDFKSMEDSAKGGLTQF